MTSPKPLLTVRGVGRKPAAPGERKTTTKLGPKAAEPTSWEILDAGGQIVGHVTNDAAAKSITRLAELHRRLNEIGAYHHLKVRFDNGYLEIPVEMMRQLEKLMEP